MRLIVSLCNVPSHRTEQIEALLEIDLDLRGPVRPLHLRHPDLGPFNGITGLTKHGDLIAAAVQSTPTIIALLDANLGLVAIHRAPLVKDVHSIASFGGKLYAVSTGTDSLVELDLERGTETIVWRASDIDQDSNHLNGVLVHAGRLLLTGFGPKRSALWSSADNGYVLDVETGAKLVAPIYHPHSLASRHGRLCWCESSRMAVMGTDGLFIETGSGYCRGLATNGDEIFVGSSKGRRNSKSTGKVIDNPADPGLLEGSCAVLKYRREPATDQFTRSGSLPIDEYGDELYDLLLIG